MILFLYTISYYAEIAIECHEGSETPKNLVRDFKILGKFQNFWALEDFSVKELRLYFKYVL